MLLTICAVVSIPWFVVHFVIIKNICTYLTGPLAIATISGVLNEQLATEKAEI